LKKIAVRERAEIKPCNSSKTPSYFGLMILIACGNEKQRRIRQNGWYCSSLMREKVNPRKIPLFIAFKREGIVK